MDQFLIEVVGGATGALSYLIVFGVLLLCGLGLPLPEDVSLIAGGFLVYRGQANLWLMMLVGYLGILVGDSMIFFAGRRIGSKVGQNPTGLLGRVVTPEKRARVEGLFKRHGEKIVMVARFLPGVRAVTYFTAGSVGMRYWRFAFFDSVAALASAPLFVYLGYRLGGNLDDLLGRLKTGQRGVLIGLAVVVVLAIIVNRWRAAREKRANAEALARKRELEALGAVTRVSDPERSHVERDVSELAEPTRRDTTG